MQKNMFSDHILVKYSFLYWNLMKVKKNTHQNHALMSELIFFRVEWNSFHSVEQVPKILLKVKVEHVPQSIEICLWPLDSIFNINWLNFKWKLISRKRNIILKASKYAIFVRSRGGTCSTTFARRKSGTYSTRSKGGTCFTTLKSTFIV